MESLLEPLICLDEPQYISNEEPSNRCEPALNGVDSHKTRKDIEKCEAKHPNQIPQDLTHEELEAKDILFGRGQLQVQFTKIHCTSCNDHLGSAPTAQSNRYIHPLLNVLICKSCYTFYSSGEFDKDVDGSELYCRWCGQGGRVICCSKCSYVFCCKCIRQNHGKRKLQTIKNSDDWLCFVCQPEQIERLKLLCYGLYEFTKAELEIAKTSNDFSMLKKDLTLCCSESLIPKRKIDVSGHEFQNIMKAAKRAKMQEEDNKVNKSLCSQEKDEVICTPDVSLLMGVSPDASTSEAVNVHRDHSYTTNPILNTTPPNYVRLKKGIMKPKIKSITHKGLLSNNHVIPPPLAPISSLSSFKKILIPVKMANTQNTVLVKNAICTNTDWFNTTTSEILSVQNKLSNEIASLLAKKDQCKSVAELTAIHNSLQELLSTSINTFYNVRKSLKTNFLRDMQSNSSLATIPNKIVLLNKQQNHANTNGTASNNLMNPYFMPRLKVKSIAELTSVPSECIVIPDDPEPTNNILENLLNPENDYNTVPTTTQINDTSFAIPLHLQDTQLPGRSFAHYSGNRPQIRYPNPPLLRAPLLRPEQINQSPTIKKQTTNPSKARVVKAALPVAKQKEATLNTKAVDPDVVVIDIEKEKEEQTPPTLPPEETITNFDPSTIRLIKYAILESKIDQLMQNNMDLKKIGVTTEQFKKMISVKVLLQTNFSSGTLRTKSKRFYKPMSLRKYDAVKVKISESSRSSKNTMPSKIKISNLFKPKTTTKKNKAVDSIESTSQIADDTEIINEDHTDAIETEKASDCVANEIATTNGIEASNTIQTETVDVAQQDKPPVNTTEKVHVTETNNEVKAISNVDAIDHIDDIEVIDDVEAVDDVEATNDVDPICEIETTPDIEAVVDKSNDNNNKLPPSQDIEEILGGSILLKNAAINSNFDDIFTKFLNPSDGEVCAPITTTETNSDPINTDEES